MGGASPCSLDEVGLLPRSRVWMELLHGVRVGLLSGVGWCSQVWEVRVWVELLHAVWMGVGLLQGVGDQGYG